MVHQMGKWSLYFRIDAISTPQTFLVAEVENLHRWTPLVPKSFCSVSDKKKGEKIVTWAKIQLSIAMKKSQIFEHKLKEKNKKKLNHFPCVIDKRLP